MRTGLSELAAELNTTDRTLRRALKQGLVRAQRPSPRIADFSVAERAYLRRAWPLLSSLREALRTEPAVSLAVLYGSRARGDSHPRSDVDLLVGLRRNATRRELASRLSERLGLRVQLVLLEDAKRTPRFFAEVVREGRLVVDRDETWPALLAQRQRIEREAKRERHRINAEFAAAFDRDQADER